MKVPRAPSLTHLDDLGHVLALVDHHGGTCLHLLLLAGLLAGLLALLGGEAALILNVTLLARHLEFVTLERGLEAAIGGDGTAEHREGEKGAAQEHLRAARKQARGNYHQKAGLASRT